jgi:hypothetical protein
MPAAAKTINVLGAIGKLETTYGTAVSLATTDGVLLTYPDRNVGAIVNVDYSFDGDVGINPGNLGRQPLSPPGGKSYAGDLPMRLKGAGAAYTTAVVPALAHLMLPIAGFDAGTLSTSTSWTYAPVNPTAAYKSATMTLYARGESYNLKGVVANWSYVFDNPGPPTHTFSISGMQSSAVVDVTLPTITYPNLSVDPPSANGIVFSWGAFTTNAVVYSGSFNLNRVVEPRVALTSGTGHEGFIPGGYNPELTIVVEATNFAGGATPTSAGFDPFLVREAATKLALSIRFGSTQFNRWTHSFSNMQLFRVTPTAVNRAAAYELVLRPSASSPVALDDMSVLFD